MPNAISDFFSSLAGVKTDWRVDWKDDWRGAPGRPGGPKPDYPSLPGGEFPEFLTPGSISETARVRFPVYVVLPTVPEEYVDFVGYVALPANVPFTTSTDFNNLPSNASLYPDAVNESYYLPTIDDLGQTLNFYVYIWAEDFESIAHVYPAWATSTAVQVEDLEQVPFLRSQDVPVIETQGIFWSIDGVLEFEWIYKGESPTIAYEWYHNDVLVVNGAFNDRNVSKAAITGEGIQAGDEVYAIVTMTDDNGPGSVQTATLVATVENLAE